MSEDTNWTGAVMVQVPGGNAFKKMQLREHIKTSWNNYINNNECANNVTVGITSAGSWLCDFMADFEYYSCIYSSGKKLLLEIDNAEEFENTLSFLRNKITNHIKNETQFEKDLDSRMIKWEPVSKYKERVQNSQRGYLLNYFNYLTQLRHDSVRDEIVNIHCVPDKPEIEKILKILRPYNTGDNGKFEGWLNI
jgi:hypothetical protein